VTAKDLGRCAKQGLKVAKALYQIAKVYSIYAKDYVNNPEIG
jgi:hypothetical protein